MATEINGTNLLVYVEGTAVAASKTCKLTIKHDTRDCTSKDSDGWEKKGEGKRSWSMSCDGLVVFDATTQGTDDLMGFITSRHEVTLKFSTETTQQGYWYGVGYITGLDIDAANEETVGYSATFEGSESLTYATHT
jgi:predicted secreted protein